MSWCDCCETRSLAHRTHFQGGRGHSCSGTVQGEILSEHLFSTFSSQLAARWLTGFDTVSPHIASAERHAWLPEDFLSDTSIFRHPALQSGWSFITWHSVTVRSHVYRFASKADFHFLIQSRQIFIKTKQNSSCWQPLSQSLICPHLKLLLSPAWTLEQRNTEQ